MISYNVPMRDYLSHPALNASRLNLLLDSPADFMEGRKNDETRSTALGEAIHCLLLEPEHFHARFAVDAQDYGPRNAGDAKKRWDAFKKEHHDKIILDRKASLYIERFKERKNPDLKLLLARGDAETTIIIEDLYGTEYKCRPDLITHDTIVDVKTTIAGITDDALYRRIKDYRYDFSAAHYMHVCNLEFPNRFKNYVWVFVDTDSNAQHVRIVKCPQIMLELAMQKYLSCLEILRKCKKENNWPGYPTYMTELQLPKWAEENLK